MSDPDARPSNTPIPPILRSGRCSHRVPAPGEAEAGFFRAYTAEVALVGVVARVDALLAALEARPDSEGPLEACQALIDADEGQVLTVGPDEMLVMGLIADSPSLAGQFFWKAQAVVGRMALEFGRRMGAPHTDLRPQLLAAGVVAAANAALLAWLSDPAGPSIDELTGRALADMAAGMAWPAGKRGPTEHA